MRGVFLDISKAFGKVWYDGLVFKLNSFGVEGELLSLLKRYLQNREQRVVLKWLNIWMEKKNNFRVPQGFVLGLFYF